MMNTILVVDDNPKNIQLAGTILKKEGYKVIFATSGESALERLEDTENIDLILLDVMMPGINGYETCTKIKELPSFSKIPIIFVTANSSDEAVLEGFEVGGVDYVTKPYRSAELIARVKTHLLITDYQKSLQSKNRELLKIVRVVENKLARFSAPKKEKREKPVEKAPVKKEFDYCDYFFEDHKGDLTDIAEELDSQINMILLQNIHDMKSLNRLGSMFLSYSQIINTYPVFSRLGRKMEEFGSFLTREDIETSEDNFIYAVKCLESLIYSLVHWHNQVFEHKLEDPNIFDNSMLSDMETIQYALEERLEEIEGEIDFF